MDGAVDAPVVAPVAAAAAGASAAPVTPESTGDVPLYEAFPHLAGNGGVPGGPSGGPDGAPPAPRKSRWKLWLALIGLLLIAIAAAWAVMETRTSRLQSKIFADMASELTFRMGNGPSDSIRFPAASPYDDPARLCQPARLPRNAADARLRDRIAGAHLAARWSRLADLGLFATYHEKTKVGLEILDCRAQPLFTSRFPERYYDKLRCRAVAAGAKPAVHRKPRTARHRAYPTPQSGRRMGPLLARPCSTSRWHSVGLGGDRPRRPAAARWPRRSKNTATRRRAAPAR